MSKYIVKYECNQELDDGGECRGLLLDTRPMEASEIVEAWARLVMSAPLNSGKCRSCAYSTWSDCNAGGSLHIYDGETEVSFKQVQEKAARGKKGGE